MAGAPVNRLEQGTAPEEPSPYLNRELSWLDFDSRVVALAEDPSVPLLERVKFLAISAENLDHLFGVRVAGLKAQLAAGLGVRSIDGQTPAAQIHAIRARVEELALRQSELLRGVLLPELAQQGIELCDWQDLTASEREYFSGLFDSNIFPVLTPLSVDPAHPFPYISNLSFNLALVVRDPETETHRFARVKIPGLLPRFAALPDTTRFVPVEQIIIEHAQALFPGMEVLSCDPFRVTRDADLALEETEAEDLLQAIESGLRRRLRMNAVVRLDVSEQMSEEARNLLAAELELDDEDVYVVEGLLDLGALWQWYGLDRPELKHPPLLPQTPRRLARHGENDGQSLFRALRDGDMLVHHPYDSFDDTVEAFLTEAANDPHVLAIKHTLYRTSGPGNPIVRSLIRAAESGKQVVTLIELRARFDEEANIEWARALEQAGVHVVYGVVGLKAHAKVTLVVRQEPGGAIRRYCHVGTGNYNSQTARAYEDLGIFSNSEDLCADLTDLLNHLTGYSKQQSYRSLLVAPGNLRSELLAQIRQEMEEPNGRIILKANGLTDPEVIDTLYAASQAGVEIDLVIRGICCLRPGVPGLSEHIRVRSIVGRFLEHSRIYAFGREERGVRYFFGSGDLMTRNLDRRVEVVVPILDAELGQRVAEVLELNLKDTQLAWELSADGTWHRLREADGGLDVQQRLVERAAERSRSEA